MQDIIALGVTSYETFVFDNHTDYFGKDNFKVSSEGLTEVFPIAGISNRAQFLLDLNAHQQGRTDYSTFRKDCAKSGIEKLLVVMDEKTCSYYDTAGNEVFAERIPI